MNTPTHTTETVNQCAAAKDPSQDCSGRGPTLRNHIINLEHHLSRLNDYASNMDYHGLRRRLCEEVLPLVSLLEDSVNQH